MLAQVATFAAARALRLPRSAGRVTYHRHQRVRMRDGVILMTDHYATDAPDAGTVLIRTPYGRDWPVTLLGRLIAERGMHAVIQSCRGTYGSGGTFEPLLHEQADGADTVDWLRRQPFYNGRLALFGSSYQGFTEWAVAPHVGDELRAMVLVCTTSSTRDSTYAGEAFALDTVLTWAELLAAEGQPFLTRQRELRRGQPKLLRGLATMPLSSADTVAVGAAVPFFQEWLREVEPGAAYWASRVFDASVPEVRAPILMITGWHDIFLPAQLRDYAALKAAGADPHLMIGPWTHGSPGLLGAWLREGLAFLCAAMAGSPPASAVDVHMGNAGWRTLPDWPPSGRPGALFLRAGGGLGAGAGSGAPSRYYYDPTDPTPSAGGAVLAANKAGPVDNRALEERDDVLVFTGEPLESPLDLLGDVSATIFTHGEPEFFDVFVRLCDVDPRGRSTNVCDGLIRVVPGRFPRDQDGVTRVEVPLYPTAYRFPAGHRVRVQVSGGAHPRWARNPGTGEPLGSAVEMRGGQRWVYHDEARPSSLSFTLA
ncbi:CocE/NonD family hydrolase [Asanoa sp. WMMD1127]|uniref:CocE/NonD family hydrolase n=1 Tax=Asanoa sp. WMMD1127 TaxID=3016107 RepID=UPI002416152C|nr:CocE/NonD family hydrolase [Asanoa sp. WMMD1127]MDG4826906.1 CocE/NonD family hydrolase [Asanoa sp. WMMD1127]